MKKITFVFIFAFVSAVSCFAGDDQIDNEIKYLLAQTRNFTEDTDAHQYDGQMEDWSTRLL